jgi:pyruvate/2-oxoacid:ferredoxin oxidoreductase alpha subunit
MKVKSLSGADAAGEAMRQIEPDVVPAYPITPPDSNHAQVRKIHR